MPIDDLDQLLAMELGSVPEQKKVAEQVSSLEAHVLSRIQQNQPVPESVASPIAEPTLVISESESSSLPLIHPICQYADALLPIITQIRDFLQLHTVVPQEELSPLRTQVAENLFGLPDVKELDKAGIFAAMATCINAAGGIDQEARRAAQERLKKLTWGIATAQQQANQERSDLINQFLQNIAEK